MKRTLCLLMAAASLSCLYGNGARAQSPIASIATKMTGVVDDLSKTRTGEPVQKQQKAIVHDLDELIAALEKQCQACKNGIKRNSPSIPMADSRIGRGTGGIGSLVDPGKSNKDWAKLSNRERDRILQSLSEGFPPEYRTVLERYYRRLAEEKTGSNPAPPSTEGEDDKRRPRETASPVKKP
ncbi:MAG: hypothetical protein NVSMB9_32720 [Isosphaeraceae bacterium]